jgi:hypothetical protein
LSKRRINQPCIQGDDTPWDQAGSDWPFVCPVPAAGRAWLASIRKSVGHSGPYYQ